MTFTAKEKDKDDWVNNFFLPFLTSVALCHFQREGRRFHVNENRE